MQAIFSSPELICPLCKNSLSPITGDATRLKHNFGNGCPNDGKILMCPTVDLQEVTVA